MKKKITVSMICDSNDTDAYIEAEIKTRLHTKQHIFEIENIDIDEMPKEFHWFELYFGRLRIFISNFFRKY